MNFVPENELETALLEAITGAAARPRFYEVLSASDLLVIDDGPGPAPAEGRQSLQAGRSLQLRELEIEGLPYVAAFSSSTRVRAAIAADVRTIAMNAKALFRILAGGHVILNPGSSVGKHFSPDELAQIVDGSVFAPPDAEIVGESREIMMGQPAHYPVHVTDALATFFKTKREVAAAYLAHVMDPQSGPKPHTMIGLKLDAAADIERLMGETSLVLQGVAHADEIIDLIVITEGGVSDYMTKETKPFYKRKWLSIF